MKKFNFKILITMISFSLLTGCLSNLDIQKLNLRASQLMKEGDIDGAISRLEAINDLNPNLYQTRYNLGVAYYQKENYEKSIKELTKVIELNPQFADAYYTLGVIYESLAFTLIEQNEKNKINADTNIAIADYYKNSIKNYEDYLANSSDSAEKQAVQEKIAFLGENLKKYSKE
ncbi:MAG: tetratricopeptide repeat protein [Candidatus Gastranaerophilales bacterium]|nr:tetratricopeptide repeat protein [Candidatus Gastranaerophilales bacterium]